MQFQIIEESGPTVSRKGDVIFMKISLLSCLQMSSSKLFFKLSTENNIHNTREHVCVTSTQVEIEDTPASKSCCGLGEVCHTVKRKVTK